MTSMVLRDSTLESLTSNVNGPYLHFHIPYQHEVDVLKEFRSWSFQISSTLRFEVIILKTHIFTRKQNEPQEVKLEGSVCEIQIITTNSNVPYCYCYAEII